jgi:hypothetical protein
MKFGCALRLGHRIGSVAIALRLGHRRKLSTAKPRATAGQAWIALANLAIVGRSEASGPTCRKDRSHSAGRSGKVRRGVHTLVGTCPARVALPASTTRRSAYSFVHKGARRRSQVTPDPHPTQVAPRLRHGSGGMGVFGEGIVPRLYDAARRGTGSVKFGATGQARVETCHPSMKRQIPARLP